MADFHQVIIDHMRQMVGWKAIRFQQHCICLNYIVELDITGADRGCFDVDRKTAGLHRPVDDQLAARRVELPAMDRKAMVTHRPAQ